MTIGGWILMSISVIAASAFFGWCLFHLLKEDDRER